MVDKVSAREAPEGSLSDAEKEKLYSQALKRINAEVEGLDRDEIVAKMATVSSVLKEVMPHYLWCGFYFAEDGKLVIGPYQGNVACPNIGYEGVCGASAKKKESLIVPDVSKFKGHIVCDANARSEIVIPLIDRRGDVVGVLDVDSHMLDAFGEVDKKFLEKVAPLLLEE